LTALETVAITSDQYRQAVDVLASMILGYYFYAGTARPSRLASRHLRLADLPSPSCRKPQVRAGRDGQGVLMP
jgi:hypothetical protein